MRTAVTTERSQLRVSYVWRDEVMDDAVFTEPKKVTLGPNKKTTFTIPKLGLPETYTIMRPSQTGYVLTLGTGMSGRLRLGGEDIEVGDFLERGGGERAEGAQGSFRATSVRPGDWGVIHLDGEGNHTFFFQFVRADPPLPRSGWKDSELLLPAIAFAVILHSVFLVVAFQLRSERHSLVFPGNPELAMDYLTQRPIEMEKEEEPQAGTDDGVELEPASTAGDEGKKGGEGDKERKRAPDPDKGKTDEKLPTIRKGLLTDNSRTQLKRAVQGGFDKKLGNALARMRGSEADGSLGGFGPGKGTGVGVGVGTGTLTKGGKDGSGGRGKAHADFVSQKAIKTGGKGPPRGVDGGKGVEAVAVKVKAGKASGDLGGLTHAQILKVVMSRRRGIQACYDRQLQRVRGLSGKVVIRWKIDPSGKVLGAKVGSTTMRNGAVEDCIVRQVRSMKFPSPKNGTVAVVNFPFIFAPR